jgi:hypothetical protein
MTVAKWEVGIHLFLLRFMEFYKIQSHSSWNVDY